MPPGWIFPKDDLCLVEENAATDGRYGTLGLPMKQTDRRDDFFRAASAGITRRDFLWTSALAAFGGRFPTGFPSGKDRRGAGVVDSSRLGNRQPVRELIEDFRKGPDARNFHSPGLSLNFHMRVRKQDDRLGEGSGGSVHGGQSS